jgi:hypothetical protein
MERITVATDPLTQRHAAPRPARGANARRGSRFRDRSLLLNPASVIAASVAAFLCTLVVLTARVATGRDPAVGTAISAGQSAGNRSRASLTTRASGAAVGPSSPSGAQAQSTPNAPLVTSTSGSAATGRSSIGGGDDA